VGGSEIQFEVFVIAIVQFGYQFLLMCLFGVPMLRGNNKKQFSIASRIFLRLCVAFFNLQIFQVRYHAAWEARN
jgi:hypothetical protein